MNKQFSIRESLKTAWGLIKNENMFLLIGLFLAYFIVSGIFSIVGNLSTEPFISSLLSIISSIIGLVFTLGFMKICLQIVNGEEPSIDSFIGAFPLLLKYIFAYILVVTPLAISFALLIIAPLKDAFLSQQMLNESYSPMLPVINAFAGFENVATIAGLILFVPAFYYAVRSSFYICLIVDKKMGAIESIKSSWVMSKGNFWHLVVLLLIMTLLIIAGIFALVIGLFVVAPWISITMLVIYKKLVVKLNKNEIAEPLF